MTSHLLFLFVSLVSSLVPPFSFFKHANPFLHDQTHNSMSFVVCIRESPTLQSHRHCRLATLTGIAGVLPSSVSLLSHSFPLFFFIFSLFSAISCSTLLTLFSNSCWINKCSSSNRNLKRFLFICSSCFLKSVSFKRPFKFLNAS